MRKNAGFTLVEMSISISILSLLIAGGLTIVAKTDEAKRVRITNERLQTIETALAAFVNYQGYIPCPANGLALEYDSTQGVFGYPSASAVYNSTTHVCSGGSVTNYTGMVPTREIGLPDETAYDGWGRKFTYRIGTGLGNATDFAQETYAGDISITDIYGIEKTDINKPSPYNFGAAYVIISHGPNGLGAWRRNNTTAPTLPATTSIEYANTNHAQSRPVYIQNPRTTTFDDIVVFKKKSELTNLRRSTSLIVIPRSTCDNAKAIIDAGNTALTTLGALGTQIFNSATAVKRLCDNPPISSTNSASNCNFSPKNYSDISANLAMWLDASDPYNTGVAPVNDAAIATWSDKSGNARNATAGTAPLAKTTTPFANSKPAIYFDGTRTLNMNAGIYATFAGQHTVFAVAAPTDSPSLLNYVMSVSDPNGHISLTYQTLHSSEDPNRMSVARPMLDVEVAAAPFLWVSTTPSLTFLSQPSLMIYRYDSSAGYTLHHRNFDGTKSIATNHTTSAPSTPNTGQVGLNGYTFMYIAEILVYNTSLTWEQQRMVEGYLLRKWFTGECP
jgi:prepilin-type N-terminal cleavage/methylation domain-containing protein